MAADVPFLTPEPERTLTARMLLAAAAVIVLAVGIALFATLRKAPANTGAALAADAYAASLGITNVTMSEATNGTGGKATYVEGTVTNNGARTLTAANVQVAFATSDGTPPHRETLPLAIVRTRIPYVDLEPIASEPIPPGDHREFRLIFETVPQNWDVMPPAIQVVHTSLK